MFERERPEIKARYRDHSADEISQAKIANTIQLAMLKPAPRTLLLTYSGAKGETTEREVEPLKWDGKKLTAHCRLAEAKGDPSCIRHFLLERIVKCREGEPFRLREGHRIECVC